MNLYCAPSVKSNGNTCYSKQDLLDIVEAYNESKEDKIDTNLSKGQLWRELHKRFKDKCQNSEWCWLEQDIIPFKKLKENFRPVAPREWKKNPFEWLSTTDIQNVMKQYEKQYSNFAFLGVFPSDCPAKITCELSTFSVKDLLEKGKPKVGIVYNLDTHNQSGSHWVCCYFDLDKCDIHYFDSSGSSPPPLIASFLKRVQEDCQSHHNSSVNINYNKTRLQYDSHSCGIYAMYYIISKLRNSPLKANDKLMQHLRKVYFRPRK
jgi:hypothetical protein